MFTPRGITRGSTTKARGKGIKKFPPILRMPDISGGAKIQCDKPVPTSKLSKRKKHLPPDTTKRKIYSWKKSSPLGSKEQE